MNDEQQRWALFALGNARAFGGGGFLLEIGAASDAP